MLVVSAHADTNFSSHRLKKLPGGTVGGHLDNFSGVHAVMKAYFSGKLDRGNVRIELTYGEEKGLLGAKEMVKTLKPDDVVLVVDVTATPTKKDFVIEKCREPALQQFLKKALAGLSYDIYPDCPDPVSHLFHQRSGDRRRLQRRRRPLPRALARRHRRRPLPRRR